MNESAVQILGFEQLRMIARTGHDGVGGSGNPLTGALAILAVLVRPFGMVTFWWR